MRTLEQSLQDHDLGHLRAIAELWGIELPAGDARQAAARLAQAMIDPDALHETVETLPISSQEALARLLREEGRLPWADFTAQAGDVRVMGPGRRDREKPWRQPHSDTERLLYRGLIGRAFADTPVGAKEFAYVPSELRDRLPLEARSPASAPGYASADPSRSQRANTGLVDDATTLLASLRRAPETGPRMPSPRAARLRPFLLHPDALPLLVHLLREVGSVGESSLALRPQEVGAFLERERSAALAQLTDAWKASTTWNDFELLPHLEPGTGGWPNDPLSTRMAALELIKKLPEGQWWDLDSFILGVKEQYPTYCRPGGEFESWYLRDRRTGAYLQGFEAWEAVDGAFLRALLLGPLHWFGAVDLGTSGEQEHLDRVRLTPWSSTILEGEAPPSLPAEEVEGRVLPDGRLELPRSMPRSLRYQVARLSSWLSFDGERYRYRLRPSSVQAAAKQGLLPRHLHKLLQQISSAPLPPGLLRALQRLAEDGIEARLHAATVLMVEKESLLDQLVEGRTTRRLIGERLGPKAALVRKVDVETLIEAAAEAGLLIEPPTKHPEGSD